MATVTIAATIGPHFYLELAGAGLANLPISWGAAGVNYNSAALTSAQVSSLAAVVAAHNPATLDPAASYLAAIAAGVAITSTGTPSISRTYGCLPPDITGMMAMQAAVQAGIGTLPKYYDTKGAVALPSANVTAVATAIFQRVAAIDAWAETGTSTGDPGGSSALDTWLSGGAIGAQPGITIA